MDTQKNTYNFALDTLYRIYERSGFSVEADSLEEAVAKVKAVVAQAEQSNLESVIEKEFGIHDYETLWETYEHLGYEIEHLHWTTSDIHSPIFSSGETP